jgi:hypothetical protein
MPSRVPTDPPRDLEENVQRRLVLQAARECAPDHLRALRAEQPTLAQLDRKMNENFWVGLMLFWTFFGPIAAGAEWLALRRIRQAVRANWAAWTAEPDPECEFWVLEGDVRRIVRRLPWSRRREKQEILRELGRVSRHRTAFQEKLEVVRAELRAAPKEELEKQQQALRERLERETDPLTQASLQRQLRAVEGHLEARQSLVAWGKRLKAAREECAGSLAHLRSRLSLLAAAGDHPEARLIEAASAELQAINSQLSAAQSASEEVLQLHAGRPPSP